MLATRLRFAGLYGRGLLLIAFCSATFLAPLFADEAKDHYQRGIALQERNLPFPAVEEFQQAASLRPDKKRYLDALREARTRAAADLVRQYYQAQDPGEKARLLKLAVEVNSGDETATRLLSNLQTEIVAVQEQVERALSQHRQGIPVECKELARSLIGWQSVVPSIAALLSAGDVEEFVSVGELKLKDDDPYAALDAATGALKIEATWRPALTLFDNAKRHVEERVISDLNQATKSGDLSARIMSVATARKANGVYYLSDSV